MPQNLLAHMPIYTPYNELPEHHIISFYPCGYVYLLLAPPIWFRCCMRPLTQLAAARPPTPAPAYAIRRGKDGLDVAIEGFRGDPGIRATLQI